MPSEADIVFKQIRYGVLRWICGPRSPNASYRAFWLSSHKPMHADRHTAVIMSMIWEKVTVCPSWVVTVAPWRGICPASSM
jgi:hypothetical protein